MELFTYLMAKNDHNTSVKKDLFSYLLGKNQSGTYTDYSGTSLSINNTKKGKMKVNLLGNTSQTGTPTPDNPIPVNVVSGDNEVVVTGKNLWSTIIVSYNAPGETSTVGQGYNRSKDYVRVKPSTQYIFSSKNSDVVFQGNLYYYDESKNIISQIWSFSSAFTTPNNCCYISIVGTTERIPEGSEIQLELGSTPTPYEPYQSSTYPIHLGEYELNKIGTYQDKFIRNSGKNLVNLEATQVKRESASYSNIITTNNTLSYNITTGTAGYLGYLIPTEIGKRYTLSFTLTKGLINTVYLDENITEVGSNYGSNATSGYSFTATKPYVGIWLIANTDGGSSASVSNLMLEENSTPTSYEPYGNGDWYLEKHIGKVVFTGDTYLDRSTTNENYTAFYYIQNDMKLDGTLYSNYFSQVPIATITNVIGVGIAPHNTLPRIYIGIATSTASNSNELKIWLGTHNTNVYYQLATPTYTQITGTLKDELEAVWRAYSYKGQTNISQINNDLPFELNVSVKVGN